MTQLLKTTALNDSNEVLTVSKLNGLLVVPCADPELIFSLLELGCQHVPCLLNSFDELSIRHGAIGKFLNFESCFKARKWSLLRVLSLLIYNIFCRTMNCSLQTIMVNILNYLK